MGAVGGMSDDPRPGTTAAIDRRVEHLAEKIDQLETRMAAVEANMTHARELQTMQFTAIQSSQSAVMAKLESMEARLQTKDLEAERYKSDPMATPAGQSIMKIVSDVTQRTAGIEKKVYMAAGAVALITFLAPVIAPLIRAALGLP